MSKLSELILYIASKSQDDPNYGAIKLNKILFAIDFLAYGLWGRPVTEATYVRQEHGPTPEPGQFLRERDQLIAAKRASIQTRLHFGNEQKRLVALDIPEMSLFSEAEKSLIDDTIQDLRNLNAAQLSDWTHTLIPWLEAEDFEVIPFNTIFTFRRRPISRAALQWAEQRLKELKASGDVS